MPEEIVNNIDPQKNKFSEEMLCLMNTMGLTIVKLIRCIVEKELEQTIEKQKYLENLLANGVPVCKADVSSDSGQNENETTTNS